ncbi:Fc receptor-like B [Xenopus tropicalis]|uniref:Fc receptor-like B n=1 Tax=Xenopus tropicalis TaxID=8364 RepID=A0A8J1IQ36_XENTR|nr:Fc receptor-like B [Xenopus tropicalis]
MAALILVIIAAGMEITGATVRPVVSLAPNWSMIFRRESLTVSCDLASAPQGNQSYYWYRDNQLLPTNQQNFTIQSASMFDRGNYQCRTSTSKRSAAVRLDVTDDYAILQTPPSVHEGDFLSLRCHSWAGYYEEYTVFYKGEEMIQNSTSDLLSMGAVAINASGLYKCTKKSHFFYRPAQYKATISVLELFSAPQIKLSPNPVTEGDHMTITCDTELSPHRETTELQFAFYRNGHNVQGFNSSNQYGVPSAQLEDSGNYTCEVQTPTGSVRKRSGMAHIHIQELFSSPKIKVIPGQVREGDHMTITCDTELRPHRETTELQFAFYRNGHNVQGFSLSNQYGVPSAQLEDSGNYTCEVQTPSGSVRKGSNLAHIHIQELISYPQIKVRPDQVTEGDHMTITCDTELSPHRETTELQFAFYRNGHNVQGFSLSNQYGVPSAQLEDSGNYTCEVQCPTGVRKRSNVAHIHIQGELMSLAFVLLKCKAWDILFTIKYSGPKAFKMHHKYLQVFRIHY